jgi:hypothetical protein
LMITPLVYYTKGTRHFMITLLYLTQREHVI